MTERIVAKAVGRLFSLDGKEEIGIAYIWNNGEAELRFHDPDVSEAFVEMIKQELEQDRQG